MKAIVRTTLIAGAILFCGTVRAEAPTLSETIHWMQSTLAAGNGDLYFAPHAKEGNSDLEIRQQRLQGTDCAVTFVYSYEYRSEHGPWHTEWQNSNRLNLKDVDPMSITVTK